MTDRRQESARSKSAGGDGGGGGGAAAASAAAAAAKMAAPPRRRTGGDSVENSNEGVQELEQARDTLRGTMEDMPDKMDDSEIPPVVNDRFAISKKVGSGSYGSVFMATDTVTGETVALKIESNKALKQKRKQLLHELLLYKQLQGGVGIPKVVWFGSDKALHGRQTLALELLGPSLSDLFKRGKNKGFSLDTVSMLAPQLIDRLEFCHSKGLIHRDVKPNNFVLGIGKTARRVYLIDFGLSTRYWKPGSHQHIDYEDGKRLTGTARYASVNNHIGVHHSRRDDLECLGFVLIYLVKGKLPWQGIRAKTKARKFSKIKRKKMETPLSVLCANLPPEFLAYMTYCRSLDFAEDPDYAYLRSLFWNALERRNVDRSYVFEWESNPDIYGYTAVLNVPGKAAAAAAAKKAGPEGAATHGASNPATGGGGGGGAAAAAATASSKVKRSAPAPSSSSSKTANSPGATGRRSRIAVDRSPSGATSGATSVANADSLIATDGELDTTGVF